MASCLHVLRIDRDRTAELIDGLRRQPPPVIQQAQVVARFDVELVGREHGEVMLQRLLVVPEVVITHGELEVVHAV